MATLHEIKQQQAQKKAAKGKQASAIVGAIIEESMPKSTLAQAIELISSLAIAGWSFAKTQARSKKKTKLTKAQATTQNYVDQVLEEIRKTGEALIKAGENPLTKEFEQLLYNNLYNTIGYRGYCNATIWAPGSKPGLPNRPVLFKTSKDGRVLELVDTSAALPDDLQTYWYSRCRGIRNNWVIYYQDALIQQGRIAELEELKSSLSKGNWIIGGTFGVLFLFAAIFWFMNMRRIR